MLDMKQAEKLVAQLQKAEDRANEPIDPNVADRAAARAA